ncbi:TPA: hypothetical protein L4927_004484 [Escherichia coli]|nr:hypothetical protein [Escherichia coli]HBO6827871.1 hypothetical protein [Escherichia coli]
MTGLPATAAPAEASSMAGVAVAVATTTPPDATATLQAMQSCLPENAQPAHKTVSSFVTDSSF